MTELTKKDISWLESYSEIPDDVLTIDCKHEDWEQLRQQILDDYKIRESVENRLDMAKTLKDDYMIQLFTDILRGH